MRDRKTRLRPPCTQALCVLLFLIAGGAAAQPERVVVPLSRPGDPAKVDIELMYGSVRVESHAGAEVIVETVTKSHGGEPKAPPPRADGLRRLPNRGLEFEISEEDNEVEIETESLGSRHSFHLTVKVPERTSVEIDLVHGDVTIAGISGDHEINGTNGSIHAERIAGSLVAETTNGEIVASFTAVNPDKAMAFSSFNGTVDVTFPAGLAADLVMRSAQGEILTGFDVALDEDAARIERDADGKGFRLSVEQATRGKVGGGGPELRFETWNGDVVVRKAGG